MSASLSRDSLTCVTLVLDSFERVRSFKVDKGDILKYRRMRRFFNDCIKDNFKEGVTEFGIFLSVEEDLLAAADKVIMSENSVEFVRHI